MQRSRRNAHACDAYVYICNCHTYVTGLIPAFNPGLTSEAELLNGRLAMLGLVLVLGHSLATGTPFLDTVNLFLGNRLL
jgi:hypothetical protein